MNRHKLPIATAVSIFLATTSTSLADYVVVDNNTGTTTTTHTTEQQPPAAKVILTSSRPEVKDGVDLFLTADWLIWQTRTSGLAYAIYDKNPNATKLQSSHVQNPDFDYQYGFKLGLGCNLSHDGWDALLGWSWFRDSERSHAHAGSGTLFTTMASSQDQVRTASQATSHWKLHFDTLDLEMGREFLAGKWLSLRPFFGLRSAWIKQGFDVDYYNATYLQMTYNLLNVDMHNKFWGFGPRAGLYSSWGFGSGWSLYGSVGASLLYGFFHLTRSETSFAGLVATPQEDVANSFHTVKAATELELGLQWDYMLFHDTFHIGLHAGWQQQLYFGQNQFMRFSDANQPGQFFQNQGDLGFQGWSIGARFDF